MTRVEASRNALLPLPIHARTHRDHWGGASTHSGSGRGRRQTEAGGGDKKGHVSRRGRRAGTAGGGEAAGGAANCERLWIRVGCACLGSSPCSIASVPFLHGWRGVAAWCMPSYSLGQVERLSSRGRVGERPLCFVCLYLCTRANVCRLNTGPRRAVCCILRAMPFTWLLLCWPRHAPWAAALPRQQQQQTRTTAVTPV